MPKKLYLVHLTDLEREELGSIIQSRSSKSVLVKRSYILLAADENGEKKWKDAEISKTYGVSRSTIERLRKSFIENGFRTALQGKKREVFKEKLFDGRVESKLIALRCGSTPEGHFRWSLRLLASQMVELDYVASISHESVRQLFKKTPLTRGGLKVG